MRRHRSTAGPLAAVYVLLVVYASLYPFAGWRWPAGQGIADLVALPWTPWRDRFDEWSNLIGYAPLGAVLYLAVARNGGTPRAALTAGVLVPWLLAYGLETAQHFIPGRFGTLRDWLLNAAGAAAGTLVAWLLQTSGLFDRWQRVRERWFVPDSGVAIALLVLWPVGLLFPSPVPLGMGQVFGEIRAAGQALLSGSPWAASAAQWLAPPAAESVPLSTSREGLAIALGMLAPCLVASAATQRSWRRIAMVPVAAGLALGTMTLSTALNFGPEHAFAWLTPATLPAIAAACLLAIVLAPAGARAAAAFGLVVLTALAAIVSEAPADPYYASSLQGWEAGRFIHFHGLARWVGLLWPYAAMTWLVRRLARS